MGIDRFQQFRGRIVEQQNVPVRRSVHAVRHEALDRVERFPGLPAALFVRGVFKDRSVALELFRAPVAVLHGVVRAEQGVVDDVLPLGFWSGLRRRRFGGGGRLGGGGGLSGLLLTPEAGEQQQGCQQQDGYSFSHTLSPFTVKVIYNCIRKALFVKLLPFQRPFFVV